MGTNALLLSPPDVIGLRFGYDSFSYHLGQVAARRLPAHVIENERIALDIDEPKDLLRFLSEATDGSAYNELCKMAVLERARSDKSKDHEAP
jgi:2-phospho-L-lactate guanylyltransferase (CobY/MobA/RfbA family)